MATLYEGRATLDFDGSRVSVLEFTLSVGLSAFSRRPRRESAAPAAPTLQRCRSGLAPAVLSGALARTPAAFRWRNSCSTAQETAKLIVQRRRRSGVGTSPGLRRSRQDRWICGVCGGIAERFGWPADVVRVVYLFASVISTAFPGTLFYVLLAIFIPEEEEAVESEPDAIEVDASPLSRSVALGFAVLLGVFGAHRFYTGRIGSAFAMLLTLGGLGIWWLVDVVLVASGQFRDAEGRRLLFWEADDEDDDFLDTPLPLDALPREWRSPADR